MVASAGAKRKCDVRLPEVVCVDAGNGYFKMATAGGQVSFIASVKRLSELEVADARPDAESVLVTLQGETYAFGNLARDLGGRSLFEAGKVEHTPIAVAAALALAGVRSGAVTVRLLVPDSSKVQWQEVASQIGNAVADFHARLFQRGFERFQPTASVELVTEGYPVWSWAMETGQVPQSLSGYPLTGVIDAGTGDLTCSVWSKSGTIIRSAGKSGQVSFVAPAMKELAGAIASGFAHRVRGHTPDRASILDIIRVQGGNAPEDRRYIYEQSGEAHDFTGLVEEVVRQWNRDLLHQLTQDNWASVWGQLGMVYIVGGASGLLAPLEKATGGRFQVVRLPGIEPQLINAVLMAQMG
ncbi:MAG: hypothetical protein ACHWZW_03125 [Spirulina sp.]